MLKRTILIALLLIGTASAHDPNGVWGSSSGTSVRLWSNMQQVRITVTTAAGASYNYTGYWERFSDIFVYSASGVNYRASFIDYNTIELLGSNGHRVIWSRGQAPARPQPVPQPQINQVQGPNISGTYQSTSGSSVAISCNGSLLQISFVDRQGRHSAANGRWLSQDRFEYLYQGRAGYGQMDYANNCINVIGPTGTPSTWRLR
jgi:hypothetical protein